MAWFKRHYLFLIVCSVAFFLRFTYLSYSDYQGDEIKALYLPEPGQKLTSYLLDQRKGPVQFLVTAAIKPLTSNYTNHFVTRLPFALAGFFGVVFLFKFAELHWGKKVAFFAAMFVATNGFFVALARIVQYQSFVIMFMALALWLFSLAVKERSWRTKGLYFGFIAWTFSLLAHYDGVFIAPFVFYLLIEWFKAPDFTLKSKIKLFAGSIVLPAILIFSFYIPFALTISGDTKSYWAGRFTGVAGKISSSKYLFSVYNPLFVFKIYLGLGILGISKLVLLLFNGRAPFKKLTFIKDPLLGRDFWLLVWFTLTIVFMEVIVSLPGTHIFTYLFSLAIILGLGIVFSEVILTSILSKISKAKFKIGKTFNISFLLGLALLFSYLTTQAYAVYVEHGHEYPWLNEKYLGLTLYRPSTVYHLSMFGFPYYRHWDEIGKLLATEPGMGFYSTNERVTISRYYVKLQKDVDRAGYYVFVINPQSFAQAITDTKMGNFAKGSKPVATYYNGDRKVVEIYYRPFAVTGADKVSSEDKETVEKEN